MSSVDGIVLAVLLSLVSAAGYALAAVAQSRLAAHAEPGRGSLRALLTHAGWWWSVGFNAAGALAHVAALHYGPLTLVQPLGALTLVAALPLGAHYARRRVTRGEWRGALWTLAGLVGLISVTGPATPGDALSLNESLAVAAATASFVALLTARRSAGRRLGLRHATASGIASGVGSALTQTLTAALAMELPGGPVPWWQVALLAVLIAGFAVGGLLLAQTAYRGGLAAPLAVVNLSNPAAAAVIGVVLLGESFRGGAWGWLAAAAASAVAARGVVLLTTAPPDTPPSTRPEVVPAAPATVPVVLPDVLPALAHGLVPDVTADSPPAPAPLPPPAPLPTPANAPG
ncbi:DMT family transporter [Streptomyces sp. NPDC048629]|uniref:DMT family transporter n=1 Tax=Streptomyces sp. NPDC048629 TaxID=3154824 RepID=UPI00342CBCDF